MVQLEDLKNLEQYPKPPRFAEKTSLLSKYQIPVHYLEFEYVEKCTNGRELEKILHILKSGEEGFFPHLIQATEARLKKIKPNSKLLHNVTPVLTKSEIDKNEWESLSNDLNEWKNDVNRRDHELDERKLKSNIQYVEGDIRHSQNVYIENQNKSNPKRISATDYESWDKYDPDAEMLKIDLEEEKIKKNALKNQKSKLKKNKTVTFLNFATDAEAEHEAKWEKERGNEYYKSGEYQNALQHYTSSIQCKPLVVAYTNRALVYNKLKKYLLAINDCKQAIKMEPKCFKAYLRMGQSLEALNKYDEALQAVECAIEIDANNEVAQQLANRVRRLCGKTEQKTRVCIQDINSEATCDKKPLKPILKSDKTEVYKAMQKRQYEIVSIPGTSKMSPPYYKIIYYTDPETLKLEKQKILFNSKLIHLGVIDIESDDDPLIMFPIDDKTSNGYHNKQHDFQKLEMFSKKGKFSYNTRKKKSNHRINKKIEPKNPEGAGGEPQMKKEYNFELPPIEDLQSPYVFTNTWNSAKRDVTYTMHAEIIRKLDLERIHNIIGFNLDEEMLESFISCLYRHFMVPGELDRLHALLLNITQIPRFKMLLMFLQESNKQRIYEMLNFLDQHGRSIPTNVRNIYTNN